MFPTDSSHAAGSDGMRITGNGQGFPGQHRDIHHQFFPFHQAGIGRDAIALLQHHHVSPHQFAGGQGDQLSLPFYPHLHRQHVLQGGQGAFGLVLLPEAEQTVNQK